MFVRMGFLDATGTRSGKKNQNGQRTSLSFLFFRRTKSLYRSSVFIRSRLGSAHYCQNIGNGRNGERVQDQGVATEDDLVDSSDESWEVVGQELRLKSTFLYCDLNQVIRGIRDDDQKRSLTELANNLLHYIEELGKAVKNRSLSMVQDYYNDTAQVMQEVMAALPPVHSRETDAYWEMDENVAE